METETLTIDEQLLTDFFTMKGNFEAHFVETTGWQQEDETDKRIDS